MNEWSWIVCGLSLLAAAALILWDRRKMRNTMDTLDKMLSDAIDGSFQESAFDESRLSALESRLARYLSASVLSTHRVAEEKDRIEGLISDISHQTKTPLANLLLYTELLQEEKLSPETREYTEMLYAQTEKLRFLMDALVKLSRLENGSIVLHPTQRSLAPMLEQVTRQFATKAQDKGLDLRWEETDVSACFDAKWTSEALCNLVDNAIKYTNEGSVTLSVTPYELFARVDVKDTGIGIPEAEQAKIFGRFYRAESSAEQEGVGVGLYLTREILRSEGGYLKLTSQPGDGSTFSLFLPV